MSDFPKVMVKGPQRRQANTQADQVRFEFDGFTVKGSGTTANVVVDEAAAFDPAEHTVAEVQDHLNSADDAERDRVLAAEREGKGRSSLLA